jgi:hypothetical protein
MTLLILIVTPSNFSIGGSIRHTASIFSSIIGGFRFLVQDLIWKCSGETRAKGNNGKLKPTSTLADLLASFNLNSAENIFELVDFLQKGLKDQEITSLTELQYFLTDSNDAVTV